MKRNLLLTAAALLIALGVSAQEKGESYIGLSLGYNTSTNSLNITQTTTLLGKETTTKDKVSLKGGDNLGVGVEFGYFLADNVRLGGYFNYGYNGGKGRDVVHSIEIMPNVAYYVKLAERFYYTPNIAFGFSCSVQPSDVERVGNLTMCGFSAGIQPLAVEFRPIDRFAMGVSLCSLQFNYLAGKTKLSGEYIDAASKTRYNSNTLSFDLLANAQVTFKYYF